MLIQLRWRVMFTARVCRHYVTQCLCKLNHLVFPYVMEAESVWGGLLVCNVVLVLDVELHRAICPIPTIFGRLFWSNYIWRWLWNLAHRSCLIHINTIVAAWWRARLRSSMAITTACGMITVKSIAETTFLDTLHFLGQSSSSTRSPCSAPYRILPQ